jgi:zinc finger SWIM domain-containing protein 3
MDAMLSYRYMSHKFHNLADRASNFPECVALVDTTLDILAKQIEEKLNACTSTARYPCTVPTEASPQDDLLTNARLKKKEVETKTLK